MADQREIVAFLKKPETHGGKAVAYFETHISHVFLAGDTAYKLKKAVRLDFLDFSTLSRRKEACERELAINRRFSPALYLGVIPVTERAGALALGGAGAPRDWLVEMRRFDNAGRFDALARAGALAEAHVDGLARLVARLHGKAEIRTDMGGSKILAESTARVMSALQKANAPGVGRREVETLGRRLLAAIDAQDALLEARRRQGHVRFCHGDMHLANICLFEGRPALFDAIEFDDAVAAVDVLYDIAFPAMDLVRAGRGDLANLMLNRYLEAAGGYDGLAAMPAFLAVRAAIRAMAEGVAAAPGPQGDERRAAARGYFELSGAFLDSAGAAPHLIAVGGLSGSGKSALARALAPHIGPPPGAVALRSDAIRKRLWGKQPEDRLGADAYRSEVSAKVYAMLHDQARLALAGGARVLADATFLRPEDRSAIAAVAREAGVRFSGIWLEAPEEVLLKRVGARKGDASDADARVVLLQSRQRVGAVDWIRIDANRSPPEVAEEALLLIKEN